MDSKETKVQFGELDERQRMLVSANAKNGGTWLVVIPGGAWRDEAIDEVAGLKQLRSLGDGFSGAASISYRLAQTAPHPAALEDVKLGLEHLFLQYDVEKFVILGHSAGAFIAGQVAAGQLPLADPFVEIQKRVVQVVGLEPIIDLVALAKEYPEYRQFLADEFGTDENEWALCTPQWGRIRELVLVQSKGDELLSFGQVELPRVSHATLISLDSGKHDEVFATDIADKLKPLLKYD